MRQIIVFEAASSCDLAVDVEAAGIAECEIYLFADVARQLDPGIVPVFFYGRIGFIHHGRKAACRGGSGDAQIAPEELQRDTVCDCTGQAPVAFHVHRLYELIALPEEHPVRHLEVRGVHHKRVGHIVRAGGIRGIYGKSRAHLLVRVDVSCRQVIYI